MNRPNDLGVIRLRNADGAAANGTGGILTGQKKTVHRRPSLSPDGNQPQNCWMDFYFGRIFRLLSKVPVCKTVNSMNIEGG
jgi:hypothetical protein